MEKEQVKEQESAIKKTKKKGRKFVKDFMSFIQRGSVIDLAVGIVVGGAFQKIVSSLVNDIIMPLLSLIGKQNLSDAKVILREAVMDGDVVVKAEVALLWGSFVQAIIDFLIIAFAIFVAIRAMGVFRAKLDKRVKKVVEKVKENIKDDE
ncbi:MAG: large conductance mechanosensitive channel protein MscL [Clostridiales bacterium]|nr:large conductance mechanosensitive channel protein MscL [Clostridiales bacterium]